MHRMRCAWMLLMVLSGCTSYVTHRIEHPSVAHTDARAVARANLHEQGFLRETMQTQEGVRIAYWIGEPRDYAVSESIAYATDGRGFHWTLHLPEDPPGASTHAAQGSIVLLHPWEGEGAMMIDWAYRFASQGYVVVMPDLRAQGDSDKAPVGYGPREGHDIAALVRYLRTAHQLPEPLFLFGVSYGGAAALFAASELDEVSGTIALAPYGNAADVIRRAPATGLFGPRWLGAIIGGSRMDAAANRASRDLGVDLEHIDTAHTLQHAPCTLIVRGENDSLVTATSLRALADASPAVRYVEVPGENHLSLALRTDRLLPPLLAWMSVAATRTDAACPGMAVPLEIRTSPDATVGR